MWITARKRQQQRDRGTKRRDLREREIDEDHPALDDVDAEVRVNPRKDEAGGEARRQKGEHRGIEHYFAPVFLIASTSRLMS